jgi:dipeptidyl aminopeptidase/acylaminoacyl peptidase
LCLGLVSVLFFTTSKSPVPLAKLPIQKAVLPSPTPFPFQELTIPYLRQRTYKSNLAELVSYADNQSFTSFLTSYQSDGLKINALLTKPHGEMPKDGWPAIVFIHGYIPPKEYQTTDRYADYVNYLAQNGFVVFKIDLRGHGSSEGEPSGAYYSSDYVIDALNAHAALQASDFVNPKKIGLWGHSMAGNVVMRAVVASPDIPAVVVWAGAGYTYTDLQKYRITDASYQPSQAPADRVRRRQALLDEYGQPDEKSTFWQQVAVTNYLKDLKGAVAINHAVDDNVVSIGYSRDLNALLDKTDVPHELREYPSGGHNISDYNFSAAMANTVAFFSKYLK